MKRVVCKEEEKRKRKGEIGMGRGWRAKKRKGVRVSDTSLVSGLFPGDAILEENGERVKYAQVEKVVEAITRVPPGSTEISVSQCIYHMMIVVRATLRVTILCRIEPEVCEGQSSHLLCTHTYASKYTTE